VQFSQLVNLIREYVDSSPNHIKPLCLASNANSAIMYCDNPLPNMTVIYSTGISLFITSSHSHIPPPSPRHLLNSLFMSCCDPISSTDIHSFCDCTHRVSGLLRNAHSSLCKAVGERICTQKKKMSIKTGHNVLYWSEGIFQICYFTCILKFTLRCVLE